MWMYLHSNKVPVFLWAWISVEEGWTSERVSPVSHNPDQCFSFSFPSVKYMREATPYIKRGSPVSQISWETPPPESPRPGAPPIALTSSPSSSSSNPPSPSIKSCPPLQGDRRRIPLKMCCVTRAMTTPDPDNR